MRILKTGGVLGLTLTLAVLAAVFLFGWSPLVASTPEISFTVAGRPAEPNAGRQEVVAFAEENRFQLLGNREGALDPTDRYIHQLFRHDSHILFGPGFKANEIEVSFYRSVSPTSRSSSEVNALATAFQHELIRNGLKVERRID